jgi:homoserine dehydrogenase
MIGLGTVGSGVARLLTQEAELYTRRIGKRLVLRKILVRDVAKACKNASISPDQVTSDPQAFFKTPDMDIIIEVAGGKDQVGDYVRRALSLGKHVITANKSLLADQGHDLLALARKHGVSIAFDASCAGGIPIITALNFGLMANQVHAIYGILNGTCNFILTEMVQQAKPYAKALAEAQELGYAEADPTLDVSGQDAAQKLAILASLAFGVQVHESQVLCEGIDTLDLEGIRYGRELGYGIKLLAIGERQPAGLSLSVRPCFIHGDLPLANVHGSFNAVSVYGHAVGHTMYMGRGAGQLPTASAIVSDLLNVASGWYPQAFGSMHLWSDRHEPAVSVHPDELQSRFYIRMTARDVPGVMAKVSTILGNAGIGLSAILQHEANAGQWVPLVVTTHLARQGALRKAAQQIEQMDVIQGPPVVLRIVDMPQG